MVVLSKCSMIGCRGCAPFCTCNEISLCSSLLIEFINPIVFINPVPQQCKMSVMMARWLFVHAGSHLHPTSKYFIHLLKKVSNL